MSTCSKCCKQIRTSDIKVCSRCNATYHYQCLGLPAENFAKESKTYKATWKCTECKSVDKRGSGPSNTATPPLSSPLQCKDDLGPNNYEDLKQYFDRKFEESVTQLRISIRKDFTAESSDTRIKLQELTESVNFMTAKYDQLQEAVDIKSKVISDLQEDNNKLRCHIGDLRSQVSDLNNRLNQFEQQSRDSNIEIQCVPEYASENIKTVVYQLATTIGFELREHELLNYHRVAKLNKDSDRPRSIVVKLSSPLVRDSFIAAAKTYNRSHQNDKLNSSHLGIAADVKKPIYVCEHLTPAGKLLHAAARKVAKDKKFEFVWVRNGKILMRKDVN